MIKKLAELFGVTNPSTFCPDGRTCAFTGHRPQNLPFRFNESDKRCIALCIRRSKRAAKPRMMVHRHRVNGAAVPDVWCTAAVGMVHTAAARFHYSGIPLRLRMDSPSIWMV